MADTKRKSLRFNTPIGIAKWPKLTQPDYGSKEHPVPEGVFSVKMLFDEADPKFAAFRKKMQAYLDAVEPRALAEFAALKKPQRDKLKEPSKNELFTPVYDEDENPTGQVEMRFSMKASGVVKNGPRAGKKWSRQPDLFDAFGRKITNRDFSIWGGSELIVGFNIDPEGYFVAGTGAWGIKCQLDAVQIVTLRSGGERSASDYGFQAQEGGFSADSIASKDEEKSDEGGWREDDEGPSNSDDVPTDPSGAAAF
jgi:hypothetical protein